MKKIFFIYLIMVISVQCKNSEKSADEEKKIDYYFFNDKGELERPKNFRTWVLAGTITTPSSINPKQLFPDFQNIYIDPVSYKFWKEKGYFREGTIMVKELLHAIERTDLPVGTGFIQGPSYDIAATIKDTIKYPNVPGGWEYFPFSEDSKGNYPEFSKNSGVANNCIACHSQAKEGFGPFYELYTPLRDAQSFGKNNPEDLNNKKTLPSNSLKLLKDKLK